MDNSLDAKKVTAINADAMAWKEHPEAKVGKSFFTKMLVQDPETGVQINLLKYPAGFMTPWHDHPCSHGVYILEGTLKTNEGSFGPGSFVWFPEGSVAEHGAALESDVVVLFVTNKKFDINFIE
ncbi:MAG: DUF4437 domain-containing protein [Bacillota bacterium]